MTDLVRRRRKDISLVQLIQKYKRVLRTSETEEPIHRFLVRHPVFLPLWYPYGNRIFSKLPLGSQHVVDFAFAREDSQGVRWHFLEIERADCRLFTNKGDPSKELMHGVRQLTDWNDWFSSNLSYVTQHLPFSQLMRHRGIIMPPELTLIIGRRIDEQRRPLLREMGVRIMTYDRLENHCWGPAIDHRKPLTVCTFRGGKPVTLTTMAMKVSFSIE
jgi:hypothetical protein